MFIVPFFLALVCQSAWAQDIHFFGSLDYARTTTKNNVEYNGIRKKFAVADFTTAGLNISGKVDDKSQALIQLVHVPVANKVGIDLIQLQRTLDYGIRVRLGKQRTPNFLKSEVIQVKALYPWISAPAEVYNINPVRSFTGASLEKTWDLFSLQVFSGDTKDEIYQGSTVIKASSEDLIGARFNYTVAGLEAYASFSKLQGKAISTLPVTLNQAAPQVTGNYTQVLDLPNFHIYSTGLSWEIRNWLVISEAVHTRSSSPVAKSDTAAYASLGRRLTEKLLLLGTFSHEFQKSSTLSPSKTTSYDLTLQYALDQNTVVKVGARHVNFRREQVGTAELASGFTGAPGGNFDIYDLQVAFVF